MRRAVVEWGFIFLGVRVKKKSPLCPFGQQKKSIVAVASFWCVHMNCKLCIEVFVCTPIHFLCGCASFVFVSLSPWAKNEFPRGQKR